MLIANFIQKFLEKIENNEYITIFIHHKPDYDAYGSGYGLYQWLKDNFENKKIYLIIDWEDMTKQEKDIFPKPETIPNIDIIQKSLGIVVDTANEARILTQLHKNCNELIKIDHHPKTETYASLEYIDPVYPATSQILAEIFLELESENYAFTSKVAQYLYAGILTDTNNLLSNSVLPSTYQIISKLTLKGINRSLVHDSIFVQTLKQRKFNGYVIDQANISRNGLAYAAISRRASKKYKMEDVPTMVQILSNIQNIEVWTTLSYDFEFKKWKASIRSKNLEINNIAKEFGGGGHKKMAATVLDNKKQFYALLARLDQYLVFMGYKDVTELEESYLSTKNFMFYFYRKFKFK